MGIGEDLSDDLGPSDGAVVAGVLAVETVITHDKVFTGAETPFLSVVIPRGRGDADVRLVDRGTFD